MKKFLLCLAAVAILTGCAGRQAEQARQDSLQRALDSMAREEALRQAELARLDSIRLDSIRQDSIRQDSIMRSPLLATTLIVRRGPYNGLDYKSNFQQNLINIGFKKISYGKTYEGPGDYDDGGTKRTYETKYSRIVDGKETILIIVDDYFNNDKEITDRKISIKFPSSTEVNAFEESIKALGIKLESNDSEGREYGNNDVRPGLTFRIKGNSVRIFDMVG